MTNVTNSEVPKKQSCKKLIVLMIQAPFILQKAGL